MFTFRTEKLAGVWYANVQVHLFSEDHWSSTHQDGLRGMGATPEDAIRNASERTIASLNETIARLRASTPRS